MGGCCSAATAPELNPDGEPKTDQTPAQVKEDGTELRRAAREQDLDLMEELLQRMPVKQINSSAGLLAGMESSPDDKGACDGFISITIEYMILTVARTRSP
jgi:hypothetical protein